MSRYRKQILDLLHGLDKIRTRTMVHSTSLDGFEYIDMIRENNDRLLLNPGAYAINPVTNKCIPIWIADYVLSTYGDICICFI